MVREDLVHGHLHLRYKCRCCADYADFWLPYDLIQPRITAEPVLDRLGPDGLARRERAHTQVRPYGHSLIIAGAAWDKNQ